MTGDCQGGKGRTQVEVQRLAAGLGGPVAKELVALPQLFIPVVAGLTHHLGLMRIAKPFGHGFALRGGQLNIGHLLDAAAQGGAGGRAIRAAAGALNRAGLSGLHQNHLRGKDLGGQYGTKPRRAQGGGQQCHQMSLKFSPGSQVRIWGNMAKLWMSFNRG